MGRKRSMRCMVLRVSFCIVGVICYSGGEISGLSIFPYLGVSFTGRGMILFVFVKVGQ